MNQIVHTCIAILILRNEIQQHNNSNNGGEYEWQKVKQVSGSHHNNATMHQSNKSLPIQLVSSKNNYKNEVMSPKQNSYYYDTMAGQNQKKYIFESSNHMVDGHNEYKIH